ncbi:sodium:dicarboxylate symporter [Novosphingobium sp. PC22D]|uniref:dicarboxylate/amino acid:cation symporter n=1 Tax=Novosphingobium sp. PC22D TaxID=1962403 RepID=UPI000BF1CAA9|nr:cation:dicarboxylase symporter family transporter [Novosphingobium sp. PC22D]PEQ11583.1 sodium:dicarboxylate symporter [Novosphingobium sp. PC22D]
MTTAESTTRIPEIRVPGLLTLAGLIAGLVLGLLLGGNAAGDAVLSVATPVGSLWLKALKMTILPLVCALLFTGIIETAAAARAGAMARRTLGWIAGLLAVSAIAGGTVMPLLLQLSPAPAGIAVEGPSEPTVLPGLGDFFASLVPDNVIAAASESAMLPVIVFTALFALAASRLGEAQRRHLALFFEAIMGAMLVIIGWVLWLAPIGVFGLGFTLTAQSGAAAIGALAHYILLVSSVGALFLLGAYPVAMFAGRLSPARFAREVLPAQVVALSTQSSLASVPPMLASATRLGVSATTAEFVLPLAVTLFRVTSPAMNVAVVVYAAALAGTDLSPAMIASGVLVAYITTFGTVSLPGTISFIASTGPIAAAMGVPLWPLGVLVAVEMLPDIMRTVGNVTMDVAVTAAVDAGERD